MGAVISTAPALRRAKTLFRLRCAAAIGALAAAFLLAWYVTLLVPPGRPLLVASALGLVAQFATLAAANDYVRRAGDRFEKDFRTGVDRCVADELIRSSKT
jgi:hypothetical protein